jgi:hypothetical protein
MSADQDRHDAGWENPGAPFIGRYPNERRRKVEMNQRPSGKRPSGHGNEEGYVVVVVAALLVVFLGFVALAVDSGFLYDSRTGGQRVADAAALAGAFTFVTNPLAPQPQTAVDHATAVATDQEVLGDGVAVGDVAVTVDVPNRRVTVDLTYSEDTLFAGVLGFNSVDIGVQGIAEASPNATGSACTKPWFIPNTVLSMQAPCDACDAGEVIIQADGSLSPFAQGQLGSAITIKPGNPQQTLAPGVFAAVRFPESQGGNDYRDAISTCRDEPVTCGDTYSIEPGNMIGPTRQGVIDLVGNPPDDMWVALGEYLRSDGTISDVSKALVVAPVWDTCTLAGFCPGNDFPSGANTQISVIGFALIFLDGMQGNDVQAHIVNTTACAAGGASDEAAPYSIPVRLIRTGA